MNLTSFTNLKKSYGKSTYFHFKQKSSSKNGFPVSDGFLIFAPCRVPKATYLKKSISKKTAKSTYFKKWTGKSTTFPDFTDDLGNQIFRLELISDQLYDFDTGHFVMAANIIDLSDTALSHNHVDALAIILHIKATPYVPG